MTILELTCLGAVFFFTAAISVVTGSTSLVTVPALMQFGVEPRVAVATNMFALIFLSLGGTLPFLKGEVLPRRRLTALICLTLVGSVAGAFLLLLLPSRTIPLVVAIAMIIVALFLISQRDRGLGHSGDRSSNNFEVTGYVVTFVLGIYGGFFSGGYVAILTAAYIGFFGMTFLEAVAVTKVLNIFSSLVATAIFAEKGLVDWKLGAVLGIVSFVGAVIGAVVARRMSNVWLRRVFLAVVIMLAVKTLLLDVAWATVSILPTTAGRCAA